MEGNVKRWRQAAAGVLRGNDGGAWTRPSPRQYPHQWNWDSAFASIGWSHLDWERATRELESLLGAQWEDGMIPHVRYDPSRVDGYFPGPDRWPGVPGRPPPGVLTSGISNPPVAVSCALAVGLRQPDVTRRHAFWGRVLPGFGRWLRWFATERRLPGSPLITTVHPWESGWDNSPRWDFVVAAGLRPARPLARLDRAEVAAAERPRDADYDAYLALVEILDASGYRLAEYRRRTPFLVYDVLFGALWYQAVLDANRMAAALGARPPFSGEELAEFAAAYEEVHWDPAHQAYFDHDAVAGRRIICSTPAALAGLGAGLVPAARAASLFDRYLAGGPGLRPLWSVDPSHPGFDPVLYWRGPVWVQVNWLAVGGLEALGLHGRARGLAGETLELVRGGGFAEHFNPLDGTPGGARSFTWTAALALDLDLRADRGRPPDADV